MSNKTLSKIHVKYLLIPLILVFSLFMLLFSVSTLSIGNGLGREVNMITNNILETQTFERFEKVLKEEKIEYHLSTLNEERLLMQFIGVNDVGEFSRMLHFNFPGLIVYETGTFSSISTVTSTLKTLQTYFVVFILSFITIWTYRYRLWGLLYGVSISSIILMSLFINNMSGVVFNMQTWFTMLVIISFMIILKTWTIHNTHDEFDIYLILRNHQLFAGILMMASLTIGLIDPIYAPSSLLIRNISILMVVEVFVMSRYLPPIKTNMTVNDRFKSLFSKRDSIKVPEIVSSKFIVIFSSALMILVCGLSMSNPMRERPHSRDFSREHYLIVDSNDPTNFLEIQASLGRYNLSDKLLEYKISEEKMTWYVFDDSAVWSNLVEVKKSVTEKFDTKVEIIRKENFEFNLSARAQLLVTVALNALIFAIIFFLIGKVHGMFFIFLNVTMFIFINIFAYSFNVSRSFEYNILLSFISIFSTLITLFYKDKESDAYVSSVGSILGYASTIMALIVLPILLIIPEPTAQHYQMITLLFILTLSFIGSMFTLYYLKMTKEKVR
ncbi:MAG: hypothetical protein GX038_01045 [Erysipelothrix sp.]|nr:hypothetical protein [Erysipelothrix sp.]